MPTLDHNKDLLLVGLLFMMYGAIYLIVFWVLLNDDRVKSRKKF